MAEPVKISVKPWQEIVDEADPDPQELPAYVFSNGRRFMNPKEYPFGGGE